MPKEFARFYEFFFSIYIKRIEECNIKTYAFLIVFDSFVICLKKKNKLERNIIYLFNLI